MQNNHYISRYYQNLFDDLQVGKVFIIYGARQVGKTTFIRHYLKKSAYKYKFDSGDDLMVQTTLGSADFKTIKEYVAGYELIVIDEAQKIPHIGAVLKIMVDQIPSLRVVATGSSSFELSGQVSEPLTGRKKTLILYPIAQIELLKQFSSFELKKNIEEYLIYGSYPEIISAKNQNEKRVNITEIAHSYLLKDILELDKVKNSKTLLDLVRLIAFQVGNEVSHTELAQKLGIDVKTISRYLDLLEKGFVLYNLRGFSRNLRKEITKKSKYYFYDNGIRNALIANFNPLNLRDDVGRLWENFLFIERIKKQNYTAMSVNNYFWRTWDQKEIDLIEEREGQLFAYEFKWGNQAVKAPKDWLSAYPNAHYTTINQSNYLEFIA
ncbi:MAG: ATPase [Gammaproteobacteria bacterium]|nr:ATPase [Gammaproteobacteria bacterium]